MSLKFRTKKIFNKKPLVKVYSHPRSGTHFLEAFLAKNFYQGKDLSVEEITWGHWSDRRINKKGNPYGLLFGNHYFGNKNINDSPKIYICRDGRAVAYSIWKTPNFLSTVDTGKGFNDFLNIKIDWYGTPAKKSSRKYTIFEHWIKHVDSWRNLANQDDNLLLINYEDMLDNPYQVYEVIHNKFFPKQKLLLPVEIDSVKIPLGLLPNKASKDAWKDEISNGNNELYKKLI